MMPGTTVRLVGSRWWPRHVTTVLEVQPVAPQRAETVDVTIPDGRVARYRVEDVEILEGT